MYSDSKKATLNMKIKYTLNSNTVSSTKSREIIRLRQDFTHNRIRSSVVKRLGHFPLQRTGHKIYCCCTLYLFPSMSLLFKLPPFTPLYFTLHRTRCTKQLTGWSQQLQECIVTEFSFRFIQVLRKSEKQKYYYLITYGLEWDNPGK